MVERNKAEGEALRNSSDMSRDVYCVSGIIETDEDRKP